MKFIEFIKLLFPKKYFAKKATAFVDIRYWDYLCFQGNRYLGNLISVINNGVNKKNLAVALKYCDPEIKEIWFHAARNTYGEDKTLKILIEQTNISKLESDKMKAHIANNSPMKTSKHYPKFTPSFEDWCQQRL